MGPQFQLESFCCIAASTKGDGVNVMFNRWLKSKYFQIYDKIYICESCLALGVTGNACIHRISDRPPWFVQDPEFESFIKSLFGSGVQGYARETLGYVSDEFNPQVFREDLVDRFLAQERVVIKEHVRLLYISIDPAAGSKEQDAVKSHYTIVTAIDGNIIVGCDAIDAPREAIARTGIVKHLTALKNNKWFARSDIVCDLEMGTGFSVDYDYTTIKSVFNEPWRKVILMNSHKNGRKNGMETTQKSKLEMAKLTQFCLDAGKLYLVDKFVTSTNEIENMISKQFKCYKKTVKQGKTALDSYSVTYSGKADGPDDICTTIQRIILCMYNFFKTDEGAKYFSNL